MKTEIESWEIEKSSGQDRYQNGVISWSLVIEEIKI